MRRMPTFCRRNSTSQRSTAAHQMTPAEVGKGRGREQCWVQRPSREGSEFDERRDLVGRFLILLRQHVAVDIERHGHGGVPQPSRDDPRVDAAGEGQAGVAVPQAMQGDARRLVCAARSMMSLCPREPRSARGRVPVVEPPDVSRGRGVRSQAVDQLLGRAESRGDQVVSLLPEHHAD